MPLLDLAIPHFLGGVSQQPPAGRQPGQVEACDNAQLQVVNGLTKRPGTRHLARLIEGAESVRLAHWINRDTAERYLVLLGERRVRVFDADDGAEFQVKVNGTSTDAGRGRVPTGTPINYLDPRTPGGVVDQDEDFVIGAGDWLSVAGNSVTSYVAGRSPFKFGRRESLTTVNADTVAEVGNGAAATVSDIYQDFGQVPADCVFSVYAKKSSSALTDFELAISNTSGVNIITARFDVDSGGVITAGPTTSAPGFSGPLVLSSVTSVGDGWYRCAISTISGAVSEWGGIGTRRLRIRFHTVGASPANKRLLLFGARCHDGLPLANLQTATAPAYVHERSDLFRALTIADSTLLLNTETTVGATTGTSPSEAGGGVKGLVFVREATPGIHQVELRSTAGVSTTYSFTATASHSTVDIATGLATAINVDTKYQAGASGSTFLLFDDGSTLGAVASDHPNITAFRTNGDAVERFTDLPAECRAAGVLVRITGNDDDRRNDFYVKSVFRNAFSDADITWNETLGPAIAFQLADTTLPYTLSRRQDNAAGAITGIPNAIYFDVSVTAWDDRLVGDTLTNPDPGFVGQKINDLFLYRGRLGFLSQDKVLLSEAGEILNFWRTTVRSLPDTDPIELANATSYDTLRNAAAGGDQLIITSDRRQFQLIGEPVLTPATAQLVPLRGFELLSRARPIDAGHGVILASRDGAFSGLIEASITQDDLLAVFVTLTAQAPRYIAGEAVELSHSTLTGLTAVRAADPAVLYLHQGFRDDEENRLQSAIHRWTFDADTAIRGIGFFEEQLKQVVERDAGWYLEEQPTGVEILESTGLPITHLDRRLTEGQLDLVYDGGDDETTITLPYDISASATMQVVDAATGLIIPIVSQPADDQIVVSGDVTGSALYVGEVFAMAVTLTRPVVGERGPSGGLSPRLSHPTDVRRLSLYLADTAFLRVEVAVDLRDPSSEEFSAAGLGTGLLTSGVLNTYTGRTDFGVYAEASEMELTIRNATPFPSRVQSGRWEVRSTARAGLA